MVNPTEAMQVRFCKAFCILLFSAVRESDIYKSLKTERKRKKKYSSEKLFNWSKTS